MATLKTLIGRYGPVALGALAVLLLGLLVFLLVRRLQRSPNRAIGAARDREKRKAVANADSAVRPRQNLGTATVPSSLPTSPVRAASLPTAPIPVAPVMAPPVSRSPEPPTRPRITEPYRPPRRGTPYPDGPAQKIVYGSPFMLKLFVVDQNTLIGKRNTHLVKPGFSYTVGGGKSDFLIFLVPVPPKIGVLKYETSGCTFYPRKPFYFPDIGNNPVHDCIGTTIRVVSDKGYELFIRFEQHEDPLLELNRLMLSINVPNPTGTR
jgi:hypothetical protein